VKKAVIIVSLSIAWILFIADCVVSITLGIRFHSEISFTKSQVYKLSAEQREFINKAKEQLADMQTKLNVK
jgi:hypothetical protein